MYNIRVAWSVIILPLLLSSFLFLAFWHSGRVTVALAVVSRQGHPELLRVKL